MYYLVFLIAVLFSTSSLAQYNKEELIELDYGFYIIEYNCAKRGPEFFQYEAGALIGDLPPTYIFTQDLQLPEHCRQFSVSPYKVAEGIKPSFVRRRLVSQGQFSSYPRAMEFTNKFSNILPMASSRGGDSHWVTTEKIVTCNQKRWPFTVIGGVIWGKNADNDHFLQSHGVVTPEFFFKIIYRKHHSARAWIFPNKPPGTYEHVDDFLFSVRDIELYTQRFIDIPEKYKAVTHTKSWEYDKGCAI